MISDFSLVEQSITLIAINSLVVFFIYIYSIFIRIIGIDDVFNDFLFSNLWVHIALINIIFFLMFFYLWNPIITLLKTRKLLNKKILQDYEKWENLPVAASFVSPRITSNYYLSVLFYTSIIDILISLFLHNFILLYFGFFFSIYSIKPFIKLKTPPICLLLSHSGKASNSLQQKLINISGYRIISLLKVNNALKLDNFRSSSFNKRWEYDVIDLSKLVPIIVVDTRYNSSSLTLEAAYFSDIERIHKVFFIKGFSEEVPLLRKVFRSGEIPLECKKHCITEDELITKFQLLRKKKDFKVFFSSS